MSPFLKCMQAKQPFPLCASCRDTFLSPIPFFYSIIMTWENILALTEYAANTERI